MAKTLLLSTTACVVLSMSLRDKWTLKMLRYVGADLTYGYFSVILAALKHQLRFAERGATSRKNQHGALIR